MFCSSCGEENDDDARFCLRCGRAFTRHLAPSADYATGVAPTTAAGAPTAQPVPDPAPLPAEQVPSWPAPTDQDVDSGGTDPVDYAPLPRPRPAIINAALIDGVLAILAGIAVGFHFAADARNENAWVFLLGAYHGVSTGLILLAVCTRLTGPVTLRSQRTFLGLAGMLAIASIALTVKSVSASDREQVWDALAIMLAFAPLLLAVALAALARPGQATLSSPAAWALPFCALAAMAALALALHETRTLNGTARAWQLLIQLSMPFSFIAVLATVVRPGTFDRGAQFDPWLILGVALVCLGLAVGARSFDEARRYPVMELVYAAAVPVAAGLVAIASVEERRLARLGLAVSVIALVAILGAGEVYALHAPDGFWRVVFLGAPAFAMLMLAIICFENTRKQFARTQPTFEEDT